MLKTRKRVARPNGVCTASRALTSPCPPRLTTSRLEAIFLTVGRQVVAPIPHPWDISYLARRRTAATCRRNRTHAPAAVTQTFLSGSANSRGEQRRFAPRPIRGRNLLDLSFPTYLQCSLAMSDVGRERVRPIGIRGHLVLELSPVRNVQGAGLRIGEVLALEVSLRAATASRRSLRRIQGVQEGGRAAVRGQRVPTACGTPSRLTCSIPGPICSRPGADSIVKASEIEPGESE